MSTISKQASESQAGTPARRGRPPKVDRTAALEAGLRLIRAHGIDALTVRAIAEDVGVAPATLYGHFPDKEALLGAIAEVAWERFYVEVPARGRWRERLVGWMIDVRERLLEAPELLGLLQVVPPQPAALLRTARSLSDVLVEAGFSRKDAVLRAQGLVWTVVGFFVVESGRSTAGVVGKHEDMLDRIPPDEREATEAIIPLLGPGGGDEVYRAIAEAVVRGLK